MNKHLLDKNLDVFPQNSTFLIQILKIILKINVTLKSFLAMQFFLALKRSLLLNSSIRLQWLLFHLIKGRGKYK